MKFKDKGFELVVYNSFFLNTNCLDVVGRSLDKANLLLGMCDKYAAIRSNLLSKKVNELFKKQIICLIDLYHLHVISLLKGRVDSDFNTIQLSFDLSKNKFTIDETLQQFDRLHFNFIKKSAEQFGISVLMDVFIISKKNALKLKISDKDLQKKSSELNSFQYALYRVKEDRAYDIICACQDADIFKNGNLFNILTQKLGYKIVDNPELNDLVLYLGDQDQELHMGVMLEKEKVESKWVGAPQVFIHPIYMNPYSKNFILLRKTRDVDLEYSRSTNPAASSVSATLNDQKLFNQKTFKIDPAPQGASHQDKVYTRTEKILSRIMSNLNVRESLNEMQTLHFFNRVKAENIEPLLHHSGDNVA